MYEIIANNSTLVFAVIAMGAAGLILGLFIGLAAKIFKVESDSRADLVLELLPGANCGGCGKAGCADFAKAVASGELPPGNCPASSKETITAIAQALGIEGGGSFRKCAVVLCGGDFNQTKNSSLYNGVSDCRSAHMIAGGPKGCTYGCLGLGSCARSCPFGAIELVNGLAVVHKELCVGCGKCASACPQKLIKIVNADAGVHVYCSNPEKAPVKRQFCKVPCIGCRKCEKALPGKFKFDGFRAVVDYENTELPNAQDITNVNCPSNCLLTDKMHYDIEHDDPDHNKTKETA